jgi:Protein of unknown function (DUF1579)
MNTLDKLKAQAGSWQGTSQLTTSPSVAAEDSASRLILTEILNGTFIRMDYTWAYQGNPQEGSLLIGYQAKPNIITAHWIDTWHMREKVMICQGSTDAEGITSVRGSYAAPPGPDWGWRIVMKLDDNQTLHIIMYNISPDEQEYLAVEAKYARREKL